MLTRELRVTAPWQEDKELCGWERKGVPCSAACTSEQAHPSLWRRYGHIPACATAAVIQGTWPKASWEVLQSCRVCDPGTNVKTVAYLFALETK